MIFKKKNILKILLALLLGITFYLGSIYIKNNFFNTPVDNFYNKTSNKINWKPYNEMLKMSVSKEGKVNYRLIKDSIYLLDGVIKELNQKGIGTDLTVKEELSDWINIYNLFTIKLISNHYPLKSITELHPKNYIPLVNTVWHRKEFYINGNAISLDQIEHEILREKFKEPRIHFAINCASESCPILRAEAYEAKRIENQLEDQTLIFLNDKSKNKFEGNKNEISPIFSWFRADFGGIDGVLNFINDRKTIDKKLPTKFTTYDWSLNE